MHKKQAPKIPIENIPENLNYKPVKSNHNEIEFIR